MTYNEWYEGLSQEKKTAIKAYKKNVDKSKKSGIIKNAKEKSEVPQLHYIGKIDKRIYSCITEDIRTDEVIITDNRIQHIIERRGQEFYDKYKNVFSEIISDPDYVFKDKMPNTAIAAKTFESENSSINDWSSMGRTTSSFCAFEQKVIRRNSRTRSLPLCRLMKNATVNICETAKYFTSTNEYDKIIIG